MKVYPPPPRPCSCCQHDTDCGLTNEELKKRHWLLYIDVKCIECGKEHALTNTNNGKCIRCGGECV